jgi:hypothetical protein
MKDIDAPMKISNALTIAALVFAFAAVFFYAYQNGYLSTSTMQNIFQPQPTANIKDIISHPGQYVGKEVSIIGTLGQTFYGDDSPRTGFYLADSQGNIIDIVKPLGGNMQYSLGSSYYVDGNITVFQVGSGSMIENKTGILIYSMRLL